MTATNLNLALPTVLTSLLQGPGNLTVNAPFTWVSGTIDLGRDLDGCAPRTLTLQTANDHGLVNVVLRNHGTVQWTGGRLLYQAGTNTVINESDGTWNVTGPDLTVTGGTQAFTNAGLLHKTAAAQLVIGATFTNTGTIVDVDSGEMLMASGGLINSGTIDMASGTTLNAHLMTFANGTTFARWHDHDAGDDEGYRDEPEPRDSHGADVAAAGAGQPHRQRAVHVDERHDRPRVGTLTVAPGRTLTMQSANDHGLVNVVLRNHGTVQWTGGRLLYQAGNSTVVNETDGLWNVAAGSYQVTGGAGQVFTNAGLLQGTGAATTTLNISAPISFTPGTTAGITIVH